MNIHKAEMLRFATINLQLSYRKGKRSSSLRKRTNKDNCRCLITPWSIGITGKVLNELIFEETSNSIYLFFACSSKCWFCQPGSHIACLIRDVWSYRTVQVSLRSCVSPSGLISEPPVSRSSSSPLRRSTSTWSRPATWKHTKPTAVSQWLVLFLTV